jgi:putative ABC transport system permease protein
VNLPLLAVKNVTRNRLRIALTVTGTAVAVLAFLLLRTVLYAWHIGAEYAAKDRIGTRNKVSFILPLPVKYVEDLRSGAVDSRISDVSYAVWFGGKDPNNEKNFFATLAVDANTWLKAYDEVAVPDDQRQAWLSDPQGAVVGYTLAKKLHKNVGDTITLSSAIYPGEWQFKIDAIYRPTKKSIDPNQFWFHWDYLENKPEVPERQKHHVGWVVSRVKEPKASGEISKKIDEYFESHGDTETLTQSERELNLSFLGMFSAILTALNIVSLVILGIMMLILGNTIAMGVRERTYEYGVLRAIGFLPKHVVMMIISEAIFVGLLGGAVGLFMAYPLINGMGRWLEENMTGFFPYFRIPLVTALSGLALATALGAIAGLVPAWRASRLSPTGALRRVG